MASRYDFARAILREAMRLGLKIPPLERIGSAAFETAAKRPANAALNCDRLKATFGIELPCWRQSVAESVKAVFARERANRQRG